MATLTKELFSEIAAISGRRFVVSSVTASAADVFHVVPSDSTYKDECWVYAHNFGSTDVDVTFLWALTSMPTLSTGDVQECIDVTIPFKSGRALIFDGALLLHSLSAAVYASTTNAISIDGFVNRIDS